MKKMLLMLSLIFAMSVNAQTYDETQLIGTWEPTNIEGKLPFGIQSFTNISLGDYHYEDAYDRERLSSGVITDLLSVYDKDYEPSDAEISDFFISNGNKLHIHLDSYNPFRFIIEELTETTLKVKTYDGACSITFTKEGSTRVASVAGTSAQTTAAYNLNGQKIDNPQPNTIYIQNGQKKLMQK